MAKLLINVFSFCYLKMFVFLHMSDRHPKPMTELFPVRSELWYTCPANFYFKQYEVFSISCDDPSQCFRIALSSVCISKREQVNPRTSQGRFIQVVPLG